MKHITLLLLFAALFSSYASAEIIEISGKVTDYSGKPITGISVNFLHDYTAVTDKYGIYRIKIDDRRTYEVMFSFYSYYNENTIKIGKIESNKYDFKISLDSLSIRLGKFQHDIEFKGSSDRIETYEGEMVESHPASIISDAEVRTLGAMAKPTTLKAAGGSATDGIVVEPTVSIDANVSAGLLTSGEVNDFRKWDMWNDLTDDEFKEHSQKWNFNPKKRYTVQLVNADNTPVIDKLVLLKEKTGKILWQGRTDNTGKVELWADLFQIYSQSFDRNKYQVIIEQDHDVIKYPEPTDFFNGVNIINLANNCKDMKNVDIMFAVDATGSMGDEINYLKAELIDIISRVKENNEDLNINLSSLFYRDDNDEYLVKMSPFSTDFEKTTDFINQQFAGGGGDFPEAVDAALFYGINNFKWSENAVARIMFLILDAPPHDDSVTINRLHELTARAAMEGIRIVPVAASGVDKSTEFIMRSLALATNGTYIFLTDDSGIGGSHIKPSTDKYDVEKLNDLFIRLIEQFTSTPNCNKDNYSNYPFDDRIYNEGDAVSGVDDKDIINIINCYPNPTNGIFTLELKSDVEEMYLVDITGKIIKKLSNSTSGIYDINISDFPNGVYYVKFLAKGKWAAQGILLRR